MVLQEFLILLIKIIYKIIMSNIENEIKILLNLFNSANLIS